MSPKTSGDDDDTSSCGSIGDGPELRPPLHVVRFYARLLDEDVASIEATVEAEDEWLATLWSKAAAFGRYSAKCTPSYSNSEGALDEQASRNIAHPGNFLHYLGYLREWREARGYPGTVVTRS